jgi:hypothetical protein
MFVIVLMGGVEVIFNSLFISSFGSNSQTVSNSVSGIGSSSECIFELAQDWKENSFIFVIFVVQ